MKEFKIQLNLVETVSEVSQKSNAKIVTNVEISID